MLAKVTCKIFKMTDHKQALSDKNMKLYTLYK